VEEKGKEVSKLIVTLFEGDVAIGVVGYTENLDQWNGRNRNGGETGRHLGLGQLQDGRYYLCYGTQWEGERNYAEVISEDEAKAVALTHDLDVYVFFFGRLPNLTCE
jgi:hypothetical protein